MAGSKPKVVPQDIHRLVELAAQLVPTFSDIAAELGVSHDTLQKWRKADPTIDEAIQYGKTKVTKPIAAAILKGAKEGDAKMIDRFLKMWRPDIWREEHARNVFIGPTQINVLSAPRDLPTFVGTEGDGELIEHEQQPPEQLHPTDVILAQLFGRGR